jgi:hypothetical protein
MSASALMAGLLRKEETRPPAAALVVFVPDEGSPMKPSLLPQVKQNAKSGEPSTIGNNCADPDAHPL